MPQSAIEAFTSSLIGLPVSHVWRGYGSALFLEFGTLHPRSRRDGSPSAPRGDMSLMIEWSWRIENERAILCGSWSGEALWDDAFSNLLGAHVSSVNLFGQLPEIAIGLSNGLRVLSFMTAEGLPAWTLFDQRPNEGRWLSVEEDGLRITEKPKEALS